VRWFKLALISLLFFIAILTVFSLFVPSHLRLAKNINVASHKDTILAFAADFKSWPRWHPAFQNESVAGWKEINHGWENENYRILLAEVKENEVITEFGRPGKTLVKNVWRVIEAPGLDSVAVQWYMDFHLKWYPWEKFSGLFFEKMYGKQMEKGLVRMKSLLEELRHTNDLRLNRNH